MATRVIIARLNWKSGFTLLIVAVQIPSVLVVELMVVHHSAENRPRLAAFPQRQQNRQNSGFVYEGPSHGLSLAQVITELELEALREFHTRCSPPIHLLFRKFVIEPWTPLPPLSPVIYLLNDYSINFAPVLQVFTLPSSE